MKYRISHRGHNNILTVIVVVSAVYILAAPLMPQLAHWIDGRNGFDVPAYASQGDSEYPANKPLPDTNRLVIPAIGLDMEILQGNSVAVVDKGLWLRPGSALPHRAGNAVIVGHRYTYNPGVVDSFYHLDDVSVGDRILVLWEKSLRLYIVETKQVVPPATVSVEQPTSDERLTLYTCTPLWTSKNRLVLIAKPVSEDLTYE